MAKENGMTKKIMLIIALTALATTIFTKIGDYAVDNYRQEADSISLKEVCEETTKLRKDVDHITTENTYRDKYLADIKKFREEDAKWKIADAEWKGAMGKAINQSMYYGDSGELGDLLRISDENKKNVSKKKYE